MREISWSSIMRPQDSRTGSKLSSTISLSRRGLAGYDRAAARRCADRAVQVQRFYRVAALVRGLHLFSDRIPQSGHCCCELDLELHYVPTWNASDYRYERRSHGSDAGANLQRTDEFRGCASCRLNQLPAEGVRECFGH
jgi:hypothetical protein